jgi:hypothetical protein
MENYLNNVPYVALIGPAKDGIAATTPSTGKWMSFDD